MVSLALRVIQGRPRSTGFANAYSVETAVIKRRLAGVLPRTVVGGVGHRSVEFSTPIKRPQRGVVPCSCLVLTSIDEVISSVPVLLLSCLGGALQIVTVRGSSVSTRADVADRCEGVPMGATRLGVTPMVPQVEEKGA